MSYPRHQECAILRLDLFFGEVSDMSLLAQPWVVKTRNRVRNIRVAQVLYRRWKARFGYEESFARALLDSVGSESIVWDVGANVGLYTEKFLARGATRVVCIEPAPAALEALRAKFAAETDRVSVLPMALSDVCGTAAMAVDGASPTNQLKAAIDGQGLTEVRIMRADDLMRDHNVPAPTVLKIDVEGYELEVLRGFGELIRSKDLQAVFIEVHFALLHERGLDNAAEEISSRLSRAGFNVRWLDLSHVCGNRI
jgi:FkbM family methyltransferase